MVGEIFPLAVRSQATALATLTNFGSNFGVRPGPAPDVKHDRGRTVVFIAVDGLPYQLR
jgi:hypothetical protein